MAQPTSKVKFEFESLFWTKTHYFSKVNLQKIKNLVDVYLITYKVKEREIHGLIIEPIDKSKKYPVLIYARGGNNVDPINMDMGINFKHIVGTSLFNFCFNNGYVIYISQLSGYGENSGKDEFGGEDLNDLIALKDLIDENPICDSSKIGMLGYSRGGLMTYNVLTKVEWLRTVAVVGGPTNLIDLSTIRPEMQEKVFSPAFGASEQEKIKRSILFNTEKIPLDANVLILHGKLDDRVGCEDAEELHTKLNALKINNKLILIKDGSHGLREHRTERDKEIINWFDKYLK